MTELVPDLAAVDVVDLARRLVDVRSESDHETHLADLIAAVLAACPHLEVVRDGDTILARTNLGRATRVIVAGHIDTVPIANNVPGKIIGTGDDAVLWGRGSVDMKAGVAVALALAVQLTQPRFDVTWMFYDHEEVDHLASGLGRAARTFPDWFTGEFAILGEPTAGRIEGGCNGTMRAVVRTRGLAAHSARPWRGVNAIHAIAEPLARLAVYEARHVDVDGLTFIESLNAVGITGGISHNVIPDACALTVNHRFAPGRSVADAAEFITGFFDGFDVEILDAAEGARPGLDRPAAAEFAAVVRDRTGAQPGPKYGWTDVARFSAMGIPAVNFGPGDPNLAHADDEATPVAQIRACHAALWDWLTGPTPGTLSE